MTLVEVVRRRPPSETSYGTINVPGPLPVTPKRVQRVLLNGDVTFSSPPENYAMVLDGSTGYSMPVANSQEERQRADKKTQVLANFVKEFEHFKEEWKEDKVKRAQEIEGLTAWKKKQEEERAREEELVAMWETYSRMAQAINDLVKAAVVKFKDPRLADAQPIWSKQTEGYKNCYLPHLFTNWWLASYYAGEDYDLPKCLVQFTEEPCKTERSEITPELSRAAECLWNHFEPQLQLMLHLFWAQPNKHNDLQHPVPTQTSAYSHLSMLALSVEQMEMAYPIIQDGTKDEDGKLKFLFEHEEGEEATDTNAYLCKVLGLMDVGVDVAENKSMKGEKREIESEGEDDDRAGKRLKWDTLG